MKGGVGKTTTVVSLSETLAALDQKPVLVIDVDAQASASYCLAGNELLTQLIRDNRTVDAYFEAGLLNGRRQPARELICNQVSDVTHRGENLDVSLLASSSELRITEREIIHKLTARNYSLGAIEGQTKKILSADLEELRQSYKYVIFDCAPGISAFTAAAIGVSDLTIVPTIPDFLSHLGLSAFVNRVLIENQDQENARLPRVLITKKKPTAQHDHYVNLIREMAGMPDAKFGMIDTVIKEMAALPAALEMIDEFPTYGQKYRPHVADMLMALATDVKDALK
jgi:cellulose biosynthesis protein BcsQ